MNNMNKLNKLLREDEIIDMSQFPWSCPKKGDVVRVTSLFDLDPQEVDESEYHIKSIVTNSRIRKVEESVNPGLYIFYHEDAEGNPLPEKSERLSEYEFSYLRNWSGCGWWPKHINDWIPLSAIRKRLLADLQKKLDRDRDHLLNRLRGAM